MSLANAMRAFVSDENCDRSKMDVSAWATTYACGPEDVRGAWEAAMTAHSQQPTNKCEDVE